MAPCKGIRELNSLMKDYKGDCEDDMRLARWRKRKCVADDRIYEPNSWISATKKRGNYTIQVDDEMLDEEYKVILEGLDLDGGDDGQDYHDTRWIVDADGNVHSNPQLMFHGDVNLNGRSVDGDDFDDDVDPQYKILLENLKEDGKSYVLVVVRENENLEQIKYEQEDGELDETNLDTPETVKKSDEDIFVKPIRVYKRKTIHPCPTSISHVKEKTEIKKASPRAVRTKGRSNKMHGLEVPTTRETLKSSHVKKKKINKKGADSRTKGHPVKRPHLAEHGHNHGAVSDQIDLDYQEVLDGLRKYGGKWVYTPTTAGPVAYSFDEDVESSAVEIKKEPCDEYFTSSTVVGVDGGWCVETCDTSHTQFRKGLMKDLKRPYDEKEYKRLLKQLNRRRSVSGKLRASYRKQHIVLARKLDAASSDCPRILNLLRGFFYYAEECGPRRKLLSLEGLVLFEGVASSWKEV
ncbi:uncharacterized protein Pyn_33047 [Prunus yedoensis var. nudiflora]|uniref:Uncharacterized protein n=1 Tax=Prunus yedoensis var. nudiflora TaxID=2094558 RepID=A0A314XXA2_PRUYE|nr:uncharacterized protein Pyn_33047 [Prunus yedoensis var. nudiflora]